MISSKRLLGTPAAPNRAKHAWEKVRASVVKTLEATKKLALEVGPWALHSAIGRKAWNLCDQSVQRGSALGLLAVGLCRSGSAGLQHPRGARCATRSSSGAMARTLAMLLAALTVAADTRPRPVRALAVRGGS